jgi:hypothetical protein
MLEASAGGRCHTGATVIRKAHSQQITDCCYPLDGGVHAQIDPMRRVAAKEYYLRTLGIQWLRIPNAMVLKHPDEFVRTIVDAMKSIAENSGK